MKTKRIIATLLLVAFASFLGGCGESNTEKFTRKANEGQEQADKVNQKAATDIQNFKPNSSPYKENK